MASKTIYVTDDTTISSADPGVNYSDLAFMRAGKTSGYTHRGLLRFDLSDIPQRAIIKSATLKLYTGIIFGSDATSISISCYVITGSWNVGSVTWDNQPSRSTTAYATTTVPEKDTSSYTSFNAKTLVEAMLAGGRDSFYIRETSEGTTDGFLYVYTEESSSGTRRSYLEIEFEYPVKITASDGTITETAKSIKIYDGSTWKDAKSMQVYTESGWEEVF